MTDYSVDLETKMQKNPEEGRSVMTRRKRLLSIPLAGIVLSMGALGVGPSAAAAAGPYTGVYECYSYFGQGYTSGYFTVQGPRNYQWTRQSPAAPQIRVPNSGAGKFEVKGERLIFVSGPFVNKTKKNKTKKKRPKPKPKYHGSWAEIPFDDEPGIIASWTLEFIPITPKPKPGHAQLAPLSYIDCVQNNDSG